MAAPALVYLAVIGGDPAMVHGWAIPAATDIAFAIGVLALLGPRAPTSLKLFLVTVAIVDDMGAVAIIALFYTSGLAIVPLIAAVAILAAMFALNRLGVRSLPVYLAGFALRSEEHTSELQSLMRISYAVFCLKKKITYDKSTSLIT